MPSPLGVADLSAAGGKEAVGAAASAFGMGWGGWRGGGWGLGAAGLGLGLAATAIWCGHSWWISRSGGYPMMCTDIRDTGDIRSAPTLLIAWPLGWTWSRIGSATRHYLVRNGVERRLRSRVVAFLANGMPLSRAATARPR
jgi:hypothetical protein